MSRVAVLRDSTLVRPRLRHQTSTVDLVVSLPEGAVDAARSARPRTMILGLVGAVVGAAGLGALSLWPLWSTNTAGGAVNLAVAVSLVATAVLVYREDIGQQRTAIAILLSAAFWLVSWWWTWSPDWQVGPVPLFSYTFGYLWFVFGGIAMLQYPEGALIRQYERWYFIALAGWICGFKLFLSCISIPAWAGYNPAAWWPTVAPLQELYSIANATFHGGIIAFTLTMFALLLCKLRRSQGMDRIDAVHVIVAAGAVSISGGMYQAARLLSLPLDVLEPLRIIIGCAALVTPLAFLMMVVHRRLAKAGLADLVEKMLSTPTVQRIQGELRATLKDPGLTLWLWLATNSVYTNGTEVCEVVQHRSDRWRVSVETTDRSQFAILDLDPALQRRTALVRSVVMAAGLVLENGRLHADLQVQLAEVQASRMRIAEAAMKEQRRIEKDLHDGAQQSLLGAVAYLSAASVMASTGGPVAATIERALDSLQTAIDDMRDLARGIYPAVLSQSGLAPAIEGIAERLSIASFVRVPDTRLALPIENTIYLVACEAMTNVVKHADADLVTVQVEVGADAVEVRIHDDGRGGAALGRGSGLRNIKDRVAALNGNLQILSRPGTGTTIVARIPCA